MKKNICVYTCVTGTYDDLKDPTIIEDNIDYYCFTNNKNIKSSVWNIIYIEDNSLSDALLSRKIKLLGHDEINGKYDIYVWVDSSITVLKPVNDFISKYCDFSKHDYFSFKHHARNNIKEEMQACLFFGKESFDNINKLKKFYEKNNYNYDDNLCENGVIIRKNNKTVQKTMNLWFDMLLKYSGRDQLSFNYAASVTDLNFSRIDLVIYNNPYFKVYNHTNKKNKFSAYFKQSENDGIFEYVDGDKIYFPKKIVDSKLMFNMVIPKNCSFIDIDISVLNEFVIIDNEIEFKGDYNQSYINVFSYGKGVISKNDDSFLRISGNFKKNDSVDVCLVLQENQMDYINNYVTQITYDLSNKEELVNQLKAENDKLNKLYGEIVNSKRWKLINKLKK